MLDAIMARAMTDARPRRPAAAGCGRRPCRARSGQPQAIAAPAGDAGTRLPSELPTFRVPEFPSSRVPSDTLPKLPSDTVPNAIRPGAARNSACRAAHRPYCVARVRCRCPLRLLPAVILRVRGAEALPASHRPREIILAASARASRPIETRHLFVTGGVAWSLRRGTHRFQPRAPAEAARPTGHHAEARSLPQCRSRHNEPLPARRGVRDRRRHRNRS